MAQEASGSVSGGDGMQELQSRNMIACSNCRSQKIKCFPAVLTPPPGHVMGTSPVGYSTARPCRRCDRYGLECEYLKHRRGRRKKGEESQGGASPSGGESTSTKRRRTRDSPKEEWQPQPIPTGVPLNAPMIPRTMDTPMGQIAFAPPSAYPAAAYPMAARPTYPLMHQSSAMRTAQSHASADHQHQQAASSPVITQQSRDSQSPTLAGHLGASKYPFLSSAARYQPKREDEGGEDQPQQQPPARSLKAMVRPVRAADDESDSTYESEGAANRFGGGGGGGGMRSRKRRRSNESMYSAAEVMIDPITAGVLTETQARDLFAIFIKEINPSGPLLDPRIDTFDAIRSRSAFLMTAICTVTSRFFCGERQNLVDPSILDPDDDWSFRDYHPLPPHLARVTHQRCLTMAREQMTCAFADALSSIEVVQAMTMLAAWKEPDDDKAVFYFNRAVVLGKELQLGKPASDVAEDAMLRRARQRVWLVLFVVSTVFSMQFNQPLLITHEDPAVANSVEWLRHTDLPSLDLSLVASVAMRCRFLHYKNLLEITANTLESEPPAASSIASLMSLSVMLRTMNRDILDTHHYWSERIRDELGLAKAPVKPELWRSGFRLHLNLIIMNQVLRAVQLDDRYNQSLGSLGSFHHCLAAACNVMVQVSRLPKRQIAFASDTLLHFTIYAGYFLYTLCAKSSKHRLEPDEIAECHRLMLTAADALDAGSLHPTDSPALHSRFLRRLVRNTQQQQRSDAASGVSTQEPPNTANGMASLAPPASAGFPTSTPLNGLSEIASNMRPVVPSSSQHQMQQHPLAPGIFPTGPPLVPMPFRGAGAVGGGGSGSGGLGGPIPYPIDWAAPGTDGSLWSQMDGAWWDHILHDMQANQAANQAAAAAAAAAASTYQAMPGGGSNTNNNGNNGSNGGQQGAWRPPM